MRRKPTRCGAAAGVAAGAFMATLAAPANALAQTDAGFAGSFAGQPVLSMLALVTLSLLPFAFIVGTSFAKISIVFSLLRNAIGAGNVPSGTIVSALAAILTLFVMHPVAVEATEAASPPLSRVDPEHPLEGASLDALFDAAAAAAEPFGRFLSRNAGARERALFADLAHQRGAELEPSDLRVVLPAFMVTELSEAFQIGFLIFLPFLILDLVVGNVLLALGMHMMSPTTVSLPFKLLLFVMVDGFYLLSRALVLGYAPA